MKYKIRKLSNFKKRNFFETYEPEKKINLNKDQAVPLLIRFRDIGGTLGFWVLSCLIAIMGFFGIKKKIKKFSFNRKVIEIRIKKR